MNRLVSLLLVIALPFVLSPTFAADGTAGISGQIIQSGDRTPLVGARVHLANEETGAALVSDPAGPDGSFAVEGIAPATYRIGVESEGLLYVVENTVTLDAGQSQNVHLAVSPTLVPAQSTPSRWDNPVVAGLLIGGGAIVLGLLIDQMVGDSKKDEPAASAFELE